MPTATLRSNARWTKKEDAVLLELFAQKRTKQEIAGIMGRSSDSIVYRYYAIQRKSKPKGSKRGRKPKIGFTVIPVATEIHRVDVKPEKVGEPARTVKVVNAGTYGTTDSETLSVNGKPMHPSYRITKRGRTWSRWTPEDDALLLDLVKRGKCSKEIAAVLGKSRPSVLTRKSVLVTKNVMRMKPATGSLRDSHKGVGGETPSIPGTPANEIAEVQYHTELIPIPERLIRSFIGKNGEHIDTVRTGFSVKARVQEDHTILVSSPDKENVERCAEYIREIIKEPVVGEIYTGRVVGVETYGVFVAINPLYHGLCHVSEIPGDLGGTFSVGQEVQVKLVNYVNGKCSLSMIAAQDPEPVVEEAETEVVEVLSPREITAEMTRLARQLARTNGKKMVMAIYYVEGVK